ncbi:unnamed protein product [Tetraodon nigroviridis]|uniref:(spotted green pufferfish) hypothetical protein n=1 Tax=Tetraodon nigroviridis TaxID=99883 RepID=Q4RRP4_TETNG|nr:unnamed protein product [Tetraodon nigroviridis]
MQRAVLILLLACFPCWAILINTEDILLAVGQEAEVARLAQVYVKIFMPALPGIIWPEVITGIFVNLLNALLNYIFLYPLNMGVAGSAVANTLSQFSLMGILYCYIVWTGLYKATWTACLQDWGSYLSLAIPSMVMMCIEWWTYEIGSLLAGISIAGNVRVGNSLGAKNTEQAKLSAKSTLLCAGLWIGLLTCIFLQTSFLTIYLSRLNWKKVTEEVSVKKKFRLFKKKKKGSPHPFKFKDNFKKLTFSPRLRSEWETHQAQVRKPEQQLIISCFSSEANS